MADVHDIDALLISALYGELTPADEARLATHLESHPGDRGALADLTHARSLIRDSRILDFRLDPPQAVSAMLLQEAARRAPAVRRAPADEGRESWFFRFVRSFAAHPAMAAAAMLVLVVGAAGVMKMRDRGQFDEAPVESNARLESSNAVVAGASTPADPWGTVAAGSAAAMPVPAVAAAPGGRAEAVATGHLASGEARLREQGAEPKEGGYAVGLADPAADATALDLQKNAKGAPLAGVSADGDPATRKPPAAHVAGPSAIDKKGITVTTPEIALKDEDRFDSSTGDGKDRGQRARGENAPTSPKVQKSQNSQSSSKSKSAPKPGPKFDDADGIVDGPGRQGGAASGAADPSTVATSAPPPPPPAPPSVKPAPAPAKVAAQQERNAPADKVDATRSGDTSTLDAWAATQLSQVVTLAHADRCDDAAKLAVTISTRAPGYYAEKVATNRELKQCMAYIAAAQDRAEKAAAEKRAAASKRATDSTK